MEITSEYLEAIDYLRNNKSGFLFLSGKAGTGKSTFLKVFEKELNNSKNIVKVAPTGIAALNIGGETIHSFFGFNTKMKLFPLKGIKSKKKKLASIDILVIDEISMVRADLLDNIDSLLRNTLENQNPFGGKMILAIGDPLQLPPVLTKLDKERFNKEYSSPFFFNAKCFENLNYKKIILTKVFRQDDKPFVNFLDCVRENKLSFENIQKFNNASKIEKLEDDFKGLILCSTRYAADSINVEKLKKLHSKSKIYECEKEGIIYKNSIPVDEKIELKIGAKVLISRNDKNGQYVNGDIGVVLKLEKDYIVVEKTNGDVVNVDQVVWDFYRYNEEGQSEKVGSFKQIPIRLGYALTIHKSQGLTISDELAIDVGSRGCFENGQLYVAVSRATEFKNIKLLKSISSSDIKTSKEVLEFMNG